MLVLPIGLLFLPSWVGAWSSDSSPADSIVDANGLMPRQQAAAPCRLNYTTDVWTGCDDVLAQFGISLDQFRLANPGIGDACDGYIPGKTYCVAACKAQKEGWNRRTCARANLSRSTIDDEDVYQRTVWFSGKLHRHMCREPVGRLLRQWWLVSIPARPDLDRVSVSNAFHISQLWHR